MRVTVEPIVFLYNVGNTVQLSVQQDFIFSRLCSQNYSVKMCDDWWTMAEMSWVEGAAVQRVMWMSVITGLIAVVSAQFLGAALDRYSRKLVMLVPFLGSLALSLMCLVVAAVPTLPLDYLYVGAAINGVAGGFVVFKSSVSTYVVSISTPDERTKKLSVVESMLFLGSAAGPFALQLLALYVTTSHAFLFLGCEVVMILAIVYIMVVLPDYNNNSKRHPSLCESENAVITNSYDNNENYTSDAVSSNDYGAIIRSNKDTSGGSVVMKSFTDAIRVTFRKRPEGKRMAIIALLVADFFIAIVFAAEFDLLYLYMQECFGFSLPRFSLFLGIKNLVNAASLLVLLPAVRWLLGGNDAALGVLGGLSRVAAFSLLALTSSPQLVFLVPFLDVFGQYLFVVLRSIISSLVQKEEQGRVLTVMSAMAQLSLLSGSVIFDQLYPLFLARHNPGTTFLLAAGSLGVSSLILAYVQWHLNIIKNRAELQPLLQ